MAQTFPEFLQPFECPDGYSMGFIPSPIVPSAAPQAFSDLISLISQIPATTEPALWLHAMVAQCRDTIARPGLTSCQRRHREAKVHAYYAEYLALTAPRSAGEQSESSAASAVTKKGTS